MNESVQDETLFAVGELANESKPKRGRPRIYADDAARKRAYNARRAQAYARTRAAEQRSQRWEAKARDLREQLELARKRFQRVEESHGREVARLRQLATRFRGQFSSMLDLKQEAVERSRQAVDEARTLRQRLARAERAVHAYGVDDRLDRLELRAQVREVEQQRDRALREARRLREQLRQTKESP